MTNFQPIICPSCQHPMDGHHFRYGCQHRIHDGARICGCEMTKSDLDMLSCPRCGEDLNCCDCENHQVEGEA